MVQSMTTPERDEAGMALFVDRDLHGARFNRCDLSHAVLRGVDVNHAEIDSPWLCKDGGSLLVNGVDVAPYVDAELDRRFPGRAQRRAQEPAALREAWTSAQSAWAAVLARAEAMPADTVDISVDGEWSVAQTLRHLVMATDVWLGRAILGREQPYHPLGMPFAEFESDGYDTSAFTTEQPTWAQVLEARADRVAMVRAFLDGLEPPELATPRRNPWAPEHPETTLSCLRTILDEEWEHLRFAVRDLEAIAAREQPAAE